MLPPIQIETKPIWIVMLTHCVVLPYISMHGRSNGKKNRQTTDKKELKKEKGPLIINQSRPASDIQAAISFDSTESIL
jgi:hypothetical protein